MAMLRAQPVYNFGGGAQAGAGYRLAPGWLPKPQSKPVTTVEPSGKPIRDLGGYHILGYPDPIQSPPDVLVTQTTPVTVAQAQSQAQGLPILPLALAGLALFLLMKK